MPLRCHLLQIARAVILEKPLIAVLETDPARGALTQREVTEWITAVKPTWPAFSQGLLSLVMIAYFRGHHAADTQVVTQAWIVS